MIFFILIYLIGCIMAYLAFRKLATGDYVWDNTCRVFGLIIAFGSWVIFFMCWIMYCTEKSGWGSKKAKW